MDQALALEIMLAGESALLTGPAGSGKTYVLGRFIKLAKRSGKRVAVTATTGLAASHLGGSTIHAWSGLGIHDTLPQHFVSGLSKSRLETIRQTDVLIIDEISMLHDYRLDLVDQALRLVRDDDRPFGAVQVVLCGDFFQLPPVNRRGEVGGGFVTGSKAWGELDPAILYLQEQHRQDDDAFLEILNALRAGDIRRRHAEALLGRIDTVVTGAATELHTINADVDWINEARLESIPGEPHRYAMETVGKTNYVESLKRSCLAQEALVLKVGALVMCIKNHPQGRYVNGSLGTVVSFEDETDYPVVELRDGRTLTVAPETWELRDGETKRASLTQVPLRLAWAITVHKSQGMTLDAARIDLRRAFTPGMGYVALSRVRRLDTMSLVGINKMALRVSSDALAIDGELKRRAADDTERFKHLTEAAKRRAEAPDEAEAMSSGKSGWTERVTKMRQTHPNAFKPWKTDDDTRLRQLFEDGASLLAMTRALGRHDGSIRKRLEKHFGDAVVIPD